MLHYHTTAAPSLARWLGACASPAAPRPATVVSVDRMRALVPLHTRVEFRRRDGPPAGTVVAPMHFGPPANATGDTAP
jgi:hypothetical protein